MCVEGAPKRPKSVQDLPIFGMWADRDEISDGDRTTEAAGAMEYLADTNILLRLVQ